MTISTDDVDPELVQHPLRLDIRFISLFMITFGLISSIFDGVTFLILLWLKATPEQFRTGWFLESVISASFIVLVIRTRKVFYQSRPSIYLTVATVLTMVITIVLPFTPLGRLMGFTTLPKIFYIAIVAILICYMLAVEIAKKIFYKYVELTHVGRKQSFSFGSKKKKRISVNKL